MLIGHSTKHILNNKIYPGPQEVHLVYTSAHVKQLDYLYFKIILHHMEYIMNVLESKYK